MQSTITCLMESEAAFNVTAVSENMTIFDSLESISEAQKNFLGYTETKVNLAAQKDGTVLCEYSNNLERFMQDQQLSIEEAIERLEDKYELCPGTISIVVDESCVNKIDMSSLTEKYTVLKR